MTAIYPAIRPAIGPAIRSAFEARRTDPVIAAYGSTLIGYYDPSDARTVFQDTAGTIPGAVGSPVGMLLDKSIGLARSAELLINGDFSAGSTGWSLSGGATVSGGKCNFPSPAGLLRSSSLATTVGTLYEVRLIVSNRTAGCSLNVYAGDAAAFGVVSGAGPDVEVVCRLIAAAAGVFQVQLDGGSTGTCSVSNVRCVSIAGWHLSQSTATARPILRTDAFGRKYLEFDGIDDNLVTGAEPPGGAAASSYQAHAVSVDGSRAYSVISNARAPGGQSVIMRLGGFSIYGQVEPSVNYSSGLLVNNGAPVFVQGTPHVVSGQQTLASASIGLRIMANAAAADNTNGKYYGGFFVRGTPTAEQNAAGLAALAAKAGVTL